MGKGDPFERRRARPDKRATVKQAFGPDQIRDSAELVHREPVICGKVGAISRMMNDRQRHYLQYSQSMPGWKLFGT